MSTNVMWEHQPSAIIRTGHVLQVDVVMRKPSVPIL